MAAQGALPSTLFSLVAIASIFNIINNTKGNKVHDMKNALLGEPRGMQRDYFHLSTNNFWNRCDLLAAGWHYRALDRLEGRSGVLLVQESFLL